MQNIRIPGRGAFAVRAYRSSDMPFVLELWNMAFGKEMSALLWQWKYHDNPLGFRILLCVNASDEPVVMYGGIPYRANWCGKTVEIIQLTDIMSHPGYRKTGLFVETGRVFFERFAGPDRCVFVYGFPGKYHFDIGRKHLDYREMSPGVVYLHAAISGMTSHLPEPDGCMTLVSPDDPALDDLWESVKNSYPLAIQRNAAFAGWRYGKHPLNRYELWAHRQECRDALTACVALKVDTDKAVMVDWTLPDSRDIFGSVLANLSKNLAERGVKYLETWLPDGHYVCRHAVSCGFEKRPEPTGIIPAARLLCSTLPFETINENLYYTMADGDLF